VARPTEYENLLKIGAFTEAICSEESIAQFLQAAQEMLTASSANLGVGPIFTLAYEGMFNVVMAVLEFHGVRPGDNGGHRASAINRVAADLGLSPAKQSVLTRLHDARNRVTYRKPLPPVTKADADAMRSILSDMYPAASALINSAQN
jgi:hypothetical protein